ncbi:related to rat SNF1, Celegans unc-51, Dun1p and other protein serine kinases [Cephalotrichum gorgonifer]|uniref:Related to rat SNF1, Celegans unc-51, Dun1p and other protein serine kinases n=1 Tax=Cephalotrichum gorgonifer TaxID=2041049 RepID=A0AAE8MSH1_9PEZI|nr:related to rat SNF1, Celegans unc-51, Dun1p and other protein serine kinases [Cephalotrichum gorgonifer]
MSDPSTGRPARLDSYLTNPPSGDPAPIPPIQSYVKPSNASRDVTPIQTSFDVPATFSNDTAHSHLMTSTHPLPSNPQFRSETIAPSPPATVDTSARPAGVSSSGPSSLRFHAGLDVTPPTQPEADDGNLRLSAGGRVLHHQTSSSSLAPICRTPSFKKTLGSGAGSGSGSSSIIPSPIISALGDMTPLPSPLLLHHSPGPWRTFGARPPSTEGMPGSDHPLTESPRTSLDSTLGVAKRGSPPSHLAEMMAPGDSNAAGATSGPQQSQHGRNRSISLYVPDSLNVPRRHATVSGTHARPGDATDQQEPQMRRERHLAEARGITPTAAKPPTPPPSESSRDAASDGAPSDKAKTVAIEGAEIFEANDRYDGKKRRWRAVRFLGQGTFSRVILATSQIGGEEEDTVRGHAPTTDSELDRKTLVAVKVMEQGPRGGASEDRIEMSLKRELEIMKSISHPSLVHLKAWNIESRRAILVLSYCPGGDLFDVATGHREVLTAGLIRRMFAELVGAVKYLHEKHIVHRDIKLENVLVNMTPSELADPKTDWTTYPYSVITLTDLGLSRRVAPSEKLETRCGSDDYAAPEVIMGQPYDGCATDAWSLGVLLYALLEARLPFDPHPDAHRMRSRTSHRIARVEWRWVEFGNGEDGDHEADDAKFERKGLVGAKEIAEGLLRRARTRWTVEKVGEQEWVAGALKEGGVVFREEEKGVEVE